MNWEDKLERLLEGRSALWLAREALPHSAAISIAVEGGELPRVDMAIKIATALDVSTDWLFDDTRPWDDPARSPRP